ncbi:MAG: FAD-dependent oxidoreductase [Bacteroidota bacterium]
MNLSYWEYKTWLSNVDFTIVGSGIVGLSCALRLREKHPGSKIVVLEKGILPQGASTKNAGFACFGSISEILSDLHLQTQGPVFDLIRQRWEGLEYLRHLLGDRKIDFQRHGGHEIFLSHQLESFGRCIDKLDGINEWLSPIFGSEPFKLSRNNFGFHKVLKNLVTHRFEGQLDTGKMMLALLALAGKKKIIILNSITVKDFSERNNYVDIDTDHFTFKAGRLFVASNGFAHQLIKANVKPARAQVLITKPIKDLHIKGTFHLEEGYYYFRNIHNRILLGGGRNLDFKGEETSTFGNTTLIQNRLETLLSEVILPGTPVEVERRWSGIMGIGQKKSPIVKQVSNRVFCGVRLGGMGVAIGSSVGRDLADIPLE